MPLGGQGQHVGAVKAQRAADRVRSRQQAHDRQRGHGFAAAAFPHHPQRPAGFQAEIQPGNHRHPGAGRAKGHLQISGVQ